MHTETSPNRTTYLLSAAGSERRGERKATLIVRHRPALACVYHSHKGIRRGSFGRIQPFATVSLVAESLERVNACAQKVWREAALICNDRNQLSSEKVADA